MENYKCDSWTKENLGSNRQRKRGISLTPWQMLLSKEKILPWRLETRGMVGTFVGTSGSCIHTEATNPLPCMTPWVPSAGQGGLRCKITSRFKDAGLTQEWLRKLDPLITLLVCLSKFEYVNRDRTRWFAFITNHLQKSQLTCLYSEIILGNGWRSRREFNYKMKKYILPV